MRVKSTNNAFIVAVALAAAFFITACTTDPKPGSANSTNTAVAPDPKAGTPEAVALGEQLMRSMSDSLARAKAFTLETTEQIDVIGKDGQKRTLNFTRNVTVRRPNALFFELNATGDDPLQVAAYYNGSTLTLSEKPNGNWAQTTVPGTLDHMLDDVAVRFGFPVPFGDVVYSSPYDSFIGPATKGGFAGRETIDGTEFKKLDYADEVVQVKLWLPASGPVLPKRIEILYKKAPVPLTAKVNFANWKLDAPVDDATFQFQPLAGKAQDDFVSFVKGLVSRIAPAGPSSSPTSPAAKPAASPKAR